MSSNYLEQELANNDLQLTMSLPPALQSVLRSLSQDIQGLWSALRSLASSVDPSLLTADGYGIHTPSSIAPSSSSSSSSSQVLQSHCVSEVLSHIQNHITHLEHRITAEEKTRSEETHAFHERIQQQWHDTERYVRQTVHHARDHLHHRVTVDMQDMTRSISNHEHRLEYLDKMQKEAQQHGESLDEALYDVRGDIAAAREKLADVSEVMVDTAESIKHQLQNRRKDLSNTGTASESITEHRETIRDLCGVDTMQEEIDRHEKALQSITDDTSPYRRVSASYEAVAALEEALDQETEDRRVVTTDLEQSMSTLRQQVQELEGKVSEGRRGGKKKKKMSRSKKDHHHLSYDSNTNNRHGYSLPVELPQGQFIDSRSPSSRSSGHPPRAQSAPTTRRDSPSMTSINTPSSSFVDEADASRSMPHVWRPTSATSMSVHRIHFHGSDSPSPPPNSDPQRPASSHGVPKRTGPGTAADRSLGGGWKRTSHKKGKGLFRPLESATGNPSVAFHKNGKSVILKNGVEKPHKFDYSQVFPMKTSQEEFCQTVSDTLNVTERLDQSEHTVIVGVGESESGKTTSLLANPASIGDSPGLLLKTTSERIRAGNQLSIALYGASKDDIAPLVSDTPDEGVCISTTEEALQYVNDGMQRLKEDENPKPRSIIGEIALDHGGILSVVEVHPKHLSMLARIGSGHIKDDEDQKGIGHILTSCMPSPDSSLAVLVTCHAEPARAKSTRNLMALGVRLGSCTHDEKENTSTQEGSNKESRTSKSSAAELSSAKETSSTTTTTLRSNDEDQYSGDDNQFPIRNHPNEQNGNGPNLEPSPEIGKEKNGNQVDDNGDVDLLMEELNRTRHAKEQLESMIGTLREQHRTQYDELQEEKEALEQENKNLQDQMVQVESSLKESESQCKEMEELLEKKDHEQEEKENRLESEKKQVEESFEERLKMLEFEKDEERQKSVDDAVAKVTQDYQQKMDELRQEYETRYAKLSQEWDRHAEQIRQTESAQVKAELEEEYEAKLADERSEVSKARDERHQEHKERHRMAKDLEEAQHNVEEAVKETRQLRDKVTQQEQEYADVNRKKEELEKEATMHRQRSQEAESSLETERGARQEAEKRLNEMEGEYRWMQHTCEQYLARLIAYVEHLNERGREEASTSKEDGERRGTDPAEERKNTRDYGEGKVIPARERHGRYGRSKKKKKHSNSNAASINNTHPLEHVRNQGGHHHSIQSRIKSGKKITKKDN